MKKLQPAQSSGYTLTELLIVIMIALLLMVVSLPMVKTVMEDARPREASRMVNSTLFTAKARAAQSDLPVGVELIMQVVGDPNANPATYQCTQMIICQVPSLYAGDLATSVATVDEDSRPNSMQPQYLDLYLTDRPITSDPPNVSNDSTTSTAYVITDQPQINNDARATGAEDEFDIRFDFRGPWYRARRTTTTNKFQILLPNTRVPVIATSHFNSNRYSCAPFQIRRPPVRVGNVVELPRGTAIDMNYSGIGQLGVQFADTAALRIMFTPEGSLYSYTRLERRPMNRFEPVDFPVFGTAHFLVGVPNKVSPVQDSSSGPYNYNDPTKSNLADGNALWVSIGRASGVVTTNENAADLTMVTDASDTSQKAAFFSNSRRYATSRETKGGR